ncbi:MAG: carbohydrate-binding family 9-like protein [Armatimonas sp.]
MILPHPRGYVCARAGVPITIDGDLSKSVWDAAPWSEEFVDIEGEFQPTPTWPTRVKMLWDEDFFYIGAYLTEPHVWATLTEHDSVIFQDNDFEVFIDPDSDNHDYGELELNALNTTWDLRLPKPYRDGGPALNEWELYGMKTAVKIDGTLNDPTDEDQGWSVEIAIPWTALATLKGGERPSVGQQWRINFSRVEWDIEITEGRYEKTPGTPEHNWVWSPQWVIDMHRPENWGYVQFEESADTPFRLDPTWEQRCYLMDAYNTSRETNSLYPGWEFEEATLRISHDSQITPR